MPFFLVKENARLLHAEIDQFFKIRSGSDDRHFGRFPVLFGSSLTILIYLIKETVW